MVITQVKELKEVPNGKYFRIVIIFIQNNNGEFLIQKVSKEKGNEYATTGGMFKIKFLA